MSKEKTDKEKADKEKIDKIINISFMVACIAIIGGVLAVVWLPGWIGLKVALTGVIILAAAWALNWFSKQDNRR